MKNISRGLGTLASLCVTAALLSTSASAAVRAPHFVGHPNWYPHFEVRPAVNLDVNRMLAASKAGKGLPLWNGTFQYDNKTYNYNMVGTDPHKGKGKSTITTVTYAYVLTMSDGTVFDPTKPACGDTESVYQRFLSSPLYNPTKITENGVNVGKVQYEDAESRGEFASLISNNGKLGNYHVRIKDTGTAVVVPLTVPAADGGTHSGGKCGKYGTVDINWLSNAISTTSWTPNTVPIVFMYDVFQTESGQCCVGGYHGAYTASNGALQTYSVATWNDPGIVSIWQDMTVFSHEIGELINDPTGSSIVPAWGHTGQTTGCQNNLEVGDPLTGTDFPAITLKGFTYHPQELAYYSWFSRDNPSLGAGGKYSMNGTFT